MTMFKLKNSTSNLFADINKKYSKPGALLKGVRYRENLNQKEFANLIGVTQGDLSKMENGKRPIGKEIAKRIEKKFGTNHKLFLVLN
jgi:plasmid maintenance system antidote protein VapI